MQRLRLRMQVTSRSAVYSVASSALRWLVVPSFGAALPCLKNSPCHQSCPTRVPLRYTVR